MPTSRRCAVVLELSLLGLLLFLAQVAYRHSTKATIAQTADSRTPTGTECDPVEMYTWEWFLAHTKPQHQGPLCGNALFYSRDMSGAARAVAADQGKVTIWDLWPCRLYNHSDAPANPMRCIHRDRGRRQAFFGNMSLAFARKACGGAGVLHSARRYGAPPREGLWAAVEEPELTRPGGPVQWLRKLRMHPAFPAPARPPLSEAELAQHSRAEAAWLRSRAAAGWLRSLRAGDGAIAPWSEIFWTRSAEPDPSQPRHPPLLGNARGARGKLEGRRRRRRRTDPADEADPECSEMDNLGFFDYAVAW